jgi:hypothetical protein
LPVSFTANRIVHKYLPKISVSYSQKVYEI